MAMDAKKLSRKKFETFSDISDAANKNLIVVFFGVVKGEGKWDREARVKWHGE